MMDFACRRVEERQSCLPDPVNSHADPATVPGLSWGHLAAVGLNRAAATAPQIKLWQVKLVMSF